MDQLLGNKSAAKSRGLPIKLLIGAAIFVSVITVLAMLYLMDRSLAAQNATQHELASKKVGEVNNQATK